MKFLFKLIPVFFAFLLYPSIVFADFVSWQTTATGLQAILKTPTTPATRTAGLGFIVNTIYNDYTYTWPELWVRGGVVNGSCADARLGTFAKGIKLGQIKIPGITPSFSQNADWSSNILNYGSDLDKVYVSRLSPGIALHSISATVRLFAGGPAIKYAAYSTANGPIVKTISGTTALSGINGNWIMVWYGNNSTFTDAKVPLNYECAIPPSYAYQADVPVLLVFENNPVSLNSNTGEGGVDLIFPSTAGNMVLLPLFGRDNKKTSETESWSGGLPTGIWQKAQGWAGRLCSFPASAAESYSYNSVNDTAIISEVVNFIPVCAGGTRFAPIPPFLGIVKDSLGTKLSFSGTVVDGQLATEYGPSLGIENTSQYTWSISGLNKYVGGQRAVTGNGQVPQKLNDELTGEINKIVSKGHLAPWMFMDDVPRALDRGDLYWINPAEVIYHLSEIYPAVPDSSKAGLLNYIKLERENYPPESVFDLMDLEAGTIRKDFSSYANKNVWGNFWPASAPLTKVYYSWRHYWRLPLYNFYALARYYDLTGETVPTGTGSVWDKAKSTLEADMAEQDWATSYWFAGKGSFYSHPHPVSIAGRHLSGLIGFVRLANKAGDTTNENLGRALLAKAVVSELALTKYPRYLYANNLIELPSTPSWQANFIAGWRELGNVINYSWTGAYDDQRQVMTMDQFDIKLHDYNGYGVNNGTSVGNGYLIGYQDLTPETARVLSDFAKQDALIYLNKIVSSTPNWYQSFREITLGTEHNMSYPGDNFQLFQATALIKGETPQNLARYRSISWLTQGGDLFYVQNLAETIKTYKGMTWSDVPLPSVSPTPTHCTPPGDLDCSGKVNILDLSSLLSAFGSTTNKQADLDDSGKVNMIDLSILLQNFGI